MRLVKSLKPLALILTAGLMLSVFAAPAMAQGGRGPGGGGMFGGGGGMFGGNAMGAPVSKADIEKMAKTLGLSAEQQTAAQTMLDGYLAGFQKKADEMRKVQEDARAAFRENQDPSVFADMRPKMQEFRKYRAESEKQFFTDVKGVLNKQQVENWSAFERSHKREQTMGRGMMSGERADVVALVEKMKLPADKMKTLKPTLDAYEAEIDAPLDRRNAVQEKFMNDIDMGSLFRGDADDSARKKAEDLIKEGREAATAVRDINRKYAKQVETTLGGAEGEKFAEEFRKSSFPQIYNERYIDRAIKAATEMKDLQAGQLEGIKALQDQYKRSAKPIDETGEKLVEEREASFSLSNLQNFRGGGQNDDKAQEQRRQRRELEDDTLTKLKAILTPEQAAKLPDRNNGGGGRQRGNGGAGGQGGDGNNSGGGQPRRQRGNGGGGGVPKDTNPPAPKN